MKLPFRIPSRIAERLTLATRTLLDDVIHEVFQEQQVEPFPAGEEKGLADIAKLPDSSVWAKRQYACPLHELEFFQPLEITQVEALIQERPL